MNEEALFHLTGTLSGSLRPVSGTPLRPALFAHFRDLTRLRYRFPLVLGDADHGPFARPLSAVMDDLLREAVPPGPGGGRVRRHVLRLEREIRVLLGEGEGGTLGELWDLAAERLAVRGGGPMRADLAAARRALRVDGDVIDCDASAPARVVGHAWRVVHERYARTMRDHIDRLVARLTGLVRGDLLRSAEGLRAEALRAGIGPAHQGLFDLDLMAHLLATPSGPARMPPRRRRRIDAAAAVLRAQAFFAADRVPFTYHGVDAATAAFRRDRPALAECVRAVAVAELEVEGRYAEAEHDAYFASFDEQDLGPDHLAWYPDRLVHLGPATSTTALRAQVLEALASGLPLKVLVEVDDLFGADARLASAAVGLGDAFVVQASSAALPDLAENVRAALEFQGPALISVFSGALRDDIPPYLVAAAATSSRAFPSFAYDPAGEPGRRLTLGPHEQPELPWPVHALAYADDALQRVTVECALTPVDLALCDVAHAGRFAATARERWAGLGAVADHLMGDSGADAPPAVYAVDAEDRLHMLVVEERLVRAARRAADEWRRLWELAAPAAAHAPVAAEDRALAEPSVAVAPAPDVASAPEPAAVSLDGEREGDAPYIETARCSSCNECIELDPRMFKYDANKQAYVADASAGTFRELVEAAESCQVAIIHPGKPRDASEPGLEELIERAKAFA